MFVVVCLFGVFLFVCLFVLFLFLVCFLFVFVCFLFCFVLLFAFCLRLLVCLFVCLFCNPIVEVVTFRLRGWCMLGVFSLPAFTHLGYECQDLLNPCDGMHACTD